MAISIGGVGRATTIGLRDMTNGTNMLGTTSTSSGSSGSGGSSGGASDADILSGLIEDMYSRFTPQEITYDAKSEEEIRSTVAEWLRPSYDQAIATRKEQTLTNKANLDADAIARGMGSSTYVTDVKNRQQNAESSDIATMESDYGATLAKYVSEGVETENDRLLEVQEFNAEQRQAAYELAYSAAIELFPYYRKKSSGGGSGQSSNAVTATSRENVETFLGLLSSNERTEVYQATSSAGAQYRAEILASVGYAGYIQLQSKYPSFP